MRHDRLLIGLLLLATVLVDGAVLWPWPASKSPPWPELQFVTLLSLAFSQTSLAAIWAGVGKKSSPWRLVGVFLVVVLWNLALATTPLFLPATVGFFLLLPQPVMIVVPLGIARTCGVRVVRGVEPPMVEKAGWPLQFSLRHLFAWTTATAIVLGVSKWLLRDGNELPPVGAIWEAQVFNTCNALMAFPTLWAALGNRASRRRMLVLLLILLGVFVLLPSVSRRVRPSVTELASILTLQSVLLLASLWVFRVAGYRLTRVRRQNPALPT